MIIISGRYAVLVSTLSRYKKHCGALEKVPFWGEIPKKLEGSIIQGLRDSQSLTKFKREGHFIPFGLKATKLAFI